MDGEFPTHRQLRHILHSKAAYYVLDRTSARGGTWITGGCLLLAKALKQLYPHTQICYVANYVPYLQHALLRVEKDIYADGDGISTEAQLLRRWQQEEGIVGAQLITYPIPEQLRCFLREVPASTKDTQLIAEYLKQQIDQAKKIKG